MAARAGTSRRSAAIIESGLLFPVQAHHFSTIVAPYLKAPAPLPQQHGAVYGPPQRPVFTRRSRERTGTIGARVSGVHGRHLFTVRGVRPLFHLPPIKKMDASAAPKAPPTFIRPPLSHITYLYSPSDNGAQHSHHTGSE